MAAKHHFLFLRFLSSIAKQSRSFQQSRTVARPPAKTKGGAFVARKPSTSWTPPPAANTPRTLKSGTSRQANAGTFQQTNEIRTGPLQQSVEDVQTAASDPKNSKNKVDWKYQLENAHVRQGWDSYQYCIASKTCLKNNNVRDAAALLEEGRRRNLPVAPGYRALITYFGLEKRSNQAIDVFLRLKKHAQSFIDDRTYSCIIRAVATGNIPNRAELAHRYYKEMYDRELTPSLFTYKALLYMCADLGLAKQALEYVDEMVIDGLEADGYIYDLVVRSFTKTNDKSGALIVALEAFCADETYLDKFSSLTIAQLHSAIAQATPPSTRQRQYNTMCTRLETLHKNPKLSPSSSFSLSP